MIYEIDSNKKILKIEKNTLSKNFLVESLSNLEIIELKGLLINKLLFAIDKNIDIQIEIPEKINRISIDTIDFSRIVGILIDNAIEESIEVTYPLINLAILKISPNCIVFIIENNFRNSTLDIYQIYEKNFSTKKGDRGYGLSNIAEIINNYQNILIHTSVKDDVFIQEIEIFDWK